MADSPTIVFCFDGLDAAYLDRFRAVMPAIDSLRRSGVMMPVRSSVPPWTACAWPTLFTGVGPGKHGTYGFFSYDGYPDTAEIVTRSAVRAPAIWNYLTHRNRRSVVMNMPVTYPAESIDGVLLPGYLAPEDAAGHPPAIRDEIAAALGEPYRIYAEGELSLSGREKLEAYCRLIRMRGRTATHLLTTEDWDLAIVQLQKTDSVFHQFSDESAFEAVYAAADNVVERVLEAVSGRPNVIICSDHGIGPATGYSIHVNDLLRDEGLIVPSHENTAPSMREHRSALLDEDIGGGDGGTVRLVAAAARTLRRGGIDPGNLYAWVRRFGLADTLETVLPEGAKRQAVEGVNWEQSQAYCRLGSEMGVRLNLAGREPAGVVATDEYDTIRDTVIECLRGARTPDGELAFEFVEPREAVYDGPAVEDAPDIVFLPTGMNHVVSPTLTGSPFVPVDTFTHKLDGVFLANGPAFDGATADRQFDPDDPHRNDGQSRLGLVDVAPIVLAAVGSPVPERLDGTVPSGMVGHESKRERYHDVRFGHPRGQSDDGAGGEVERHLEDLGYL